MHNRQKNKKSPNEAKYNIAGWIITLTSAFFFLCAILPMLLGPISGAITGFLWGVFGFSIYPILVSLITLGIFMIKGFKRSVPLTYIIAASVIFVMLIFILHLALTFNMLAYPFAEYTAEVFSGPINGGLVTAGGVVFGTIAYGLQAVLTPVFSFILFSLIIIAMVILMLNKRFKFIPSLIKRKGNTAKETQEEETAASKGRNEFYKDNRQSAKVMPAKTVGLFVENIIPKVETVEERIYEAQSGSFSSMQEKPVENTIPLTTYSLNSEQTQNTSITKKQTAREILGLDKNRFLTPFTTQSTLYTPPKLTAEPDIRTSQTVNYSTTQTTQTVEKNPLTSTASTMPPAFIHTTTTSRTASILGEVAQIPDKNIEMPTYSGGEIVNGEEESQRIKNAYAPVLPKVSEQVATPKIAVAEKRQATHSYGEGPDPRNYDSLSFTHFSADTIKREEAKTVEPQKLEEKELVIKNENLIDFSPNAPEVLFDDKYSRASFNGISIFDSTKEDTAFKPTLDTSFPYKAPPTPIKGQALVVDGETLENLTDEPSFSQYASVVEPSKVSQELKRLSDAWNDEKVEENNSFISGSVGYDTEPKETKTETTEQSTKSFSIKNEVEDLTLNHVESGPSFTGFIEEVVPQNEKIEFTVTKKFEKPKSKIQGAQVHMDAHLANDKSNLPAPAPKKKPLRYIPPPLELLAESKIVLEEDAEADKLERAKTIVETLKSLKLDVSISAITRGPTVTRYELSMPPGVPVKTVRQFITDIEYYLECGKIRIETPIPGKRAVGIEAPNNKKDIVALKEIVSSSAFKKSNSPLTFALGKDIAGDNIVCEVDKMPHLLIAGTTGSGKSVQLNSIILSIAYKSSPEDVRIILVDPKRVEFTIYKGMPHLLSEEIICDDRHALNAFKWLRAEMERRYMMFSRSVVRNIDEYNKQAAVKNGEINKLPFIVLIVDELADLMSSSFKKELEENIMSIAQKARAAGIHLILATQRPSVDVVTGTIKANLPSRIAFALKTGTDSRTILDTMGAETLLGQGDMLYAPIGQDDPKRIQGAWVSMEEVDAVIDYIKTHNETDFDTEFMDAVTASDAPQGGGNANIEEPDDLGYDPLMPPVLKMAIEKSSITTSSIQRRFAVGYARAARIVDYMEAQGYISGVDGTKPRSVHISMDQFNDLFGDEE